MGKIKEVFKIADTVIDLPKAPTNLKGNIYTQIRDAITNVFKKRTKFKQGTQEYNAALDKIADEAQELANKIRPPKKPPFLKGKGKLAGKIGGGAAIVEGTSAGLTGKGPIAETIKQTKKLPFLKGAKDGGMIVAPKMGGKPSHKAKKSSKSIAKKYFKGTF